MEFRVLGSLSVRQDDAELIRAIGKPQQLLALLLVNVPHRVSAKSLITELWDDAPPRRAMTTLQTHVLHLRTEFARSTGVSRDTIAHELLQTRDGGYQINLGEALFDLSEYHRLRFSAQTLLNAGDVPGAGRVLSQALGLWRGPVLLNVDQGRLLRATVAELDRGRLDTLALFFDTQLAVNRHREILGELTQLAVRHPHHEELHAQLMIALCRSGYRIRALEVFDDLRRNLEADLGIAPSARVVRVREFVRTPDAAGLDPVAGLGAEDGRAAPGPRPRGGAGYSPGSNSTGIASRSGSDASTA
jgi:DNA-binding SARP family transcriptional activator